MPPPPGSGDDDDSAHLAQTAAFPLRARSADEPAPTSFYAALPGTVLAQKYRIERTLGHGGMGVVLEAHHLTLDIPVAMKLLSPEYSGSPEILGRFVREARAASKLKNPHVTRVLDVGTLDSGEPFMVMEFLAGEDLAHRMKSRPVSIAEAIDFVTQASEALAEAHASGIVHRDIKPANLFVTRRPGGRAHVKVLDFGVSKVTESGAEDVGLTESTAILGSALYMSPEQMKSSKHVDCRTDVYALGACLYEMLGREPPFFAPTFPELCALVYSTEPRPLEELNPEVPARLARVVTKALARVPAERYQTVAELVQALSPWATDAVRSSMEALLAERAPTLSLLPRIGNEIALSAERARRRGAWSWLAGAALIAAGGLGYWKIMMPRMARQKAAEKAALVTSATANSSVNSAPADNVAPTPIVPAAPTVATSAAPSASMAIDAGTPMDAGASMDAGHLADAGSDASAPAAAKDRGAQPRQGGRRTNVEIDDSTFNQGAIPRDPSNAGRELTQEICTQTLPDGTKQVVPCH